MVTVNTVKRAINENHEPWRAGMADGQMGYTVKRIDGVVTIGVSGFASLAHLDVYLNSIEISLRRQGLFLYHRNERTIVVQ